MEGAWLRHQTSPLPHRRGAPRLSTVVLVGAFVTVLVLYIVLRQGG